VLDPSTVLGVAAFLLSQSSGKLYKGHCADLAQRLGRQNSSVSSMRSIFP